jgi:hypothetical protein
MLKMSSKTRETIDRASVIGFMTGVCALLSMLVALIVGYCFLPENDLAKEDALTDILSSPLVATFATIYAACAALIAFPFAFFLLVRTQLRRSIPTAAVATLLGTAIGSMFNPLVPGALSGLGFGVAAMVWCNRRLREPATSDAAGAPEGKTLAPRRG